MTSDKNAEIWSTRLQKELLALTTDNATEQETKEVAGILPPFIRIKSRVGHCRRDLQGIVRLGLGIRRVR
jgi:hypothetical protein